MKAQNLQAISQRQKALERQEAAVIRKFSWAYTKAVTYWANAELNDWRIFLAFMYVAPDPIRVFAIYHRLEKWGA